MAVYSALRFLLQRIFGAFVISILGANFVQAEALPKRVALVIGNNNYHSLSPLQNAVNDAESVGASLSAIGFTVYLVSDLDNDTLLRSVDFFAQKAETADVALFYYAGHGAQIDGINYLLPTDFQIGAGFDPETALNIDSVLDGLGSQLRSNIILIDACLDDIVAPSDRNDTLVWQATNINASLPRIGTLVNFATSPGSAAFDGAGMHSPFTGALLDHLASPNIDIELMLRRVRRDVVVNSNGQQVPVTLSAMLSEFQLNPSSSLTQSRAEPNIPLAQSLAETGFQQKPILGDLSSGIRLPGNPDISPEVANQIRRIIASRQTRAKTDASDLRQLICQRLSSPLPASCQVFVQGTTLRN